MSREGEQHKANDRVTQDLSSGPMDKIESGAEKCIENSKQFASGIASQAVGVAVDAFHETVIKTFGLIALLVMALIGFVLAVVSSVNFISVYYGFPFWLSGFIVGGMLVTTAVLGVILYEMFSKSPHKSRETRPRRHEVSTQESIEGIDQGIDEVKQGLTELLSVSEIISRNPRTSVCVASVLGTLVGYWVAPNRRQVYLSPSLNDTTPRKREEKPSSKEQTPSWTSRAFHFALPFVISALEKKIASELDQWGIPNKGSTPQNHRENQQRAKNGGPLQSSQGRSEGTFQNAPGNNTARSSKPSVRVVGPNSGVNA